MLLTIESQWKNSSFLSPLPQSRWNYQRLPGQHLACHPESKLMTISYLCNSDNWWTWDRRWPAVLHSVCSLSCVQTVASIRTTFLPIPILTTLFERLTWRVFVLVPHKQTSSLPFSLPQNILWYFLFNVTCPFSQTIIVVVSHHESLSMYIYWLFNSFVVMEILFPRRGVCG